MIRRHDQQPAVIPHQGPRPPPQPPLSHPPRLPNPNLRQLRHPPSNLNPPVPTPAAHTRSHKPSPRHTRALTSRALHTRAPRNRARNIRAPHSRARDTRAPRNRALRTRRSVASSRVRAHRRHGPHRFGLHTPNPRSTRTLDLRACSLRTYMLCARNPCSSRLRTPLDTRKGHPSRLTTNSLSNLRLNLQSLRAGLLNARRPSPDHSRTRRLRDSSLRDRRLRARGLGIRSS
ncbi:hypothetical protein GCM10009742_66840 [Kribbella karoonensis]|uniref:Uncharacterized protein n=1 Tax=Kribbella karoonensis TaxID=324851 RepID=A0ABP4QHX2_9ACTN